METQVISNRYAIEEKLGSGGMATVFLATDLNTDKKVAVKFLHPQYARDASYIERFVREAETAIHLDHPNIAKVVDYGSQRSEHFIVMEYIGGRNVAEVLKDEGTLSEERALFIAQSIANALDYAGSLGIVHRDIKPQNIMLTDKGEVKVADFGIAKMASMATMTHTGMFIGSPAYTSPEQAQGEKVDSRSDIYSLGITLYEMLSGHPPFQSGNPWSVINMHIAAEPPVIDADIAPDIKEILLKCLKKDPGERYQKPAEVAARIGTLLDARAGIQETKLIEAPEAGQAIVVPGGDVIGPETANASVGHAEDTVSQSAETAILHAGGTQLAIDNRGTAIAEGSPREPEGSDQTKASNLRARLSNIWSSPKRKALGLLAAALLLLFLLGYGLSDPQKSTDQNAGVSSSVKASADNTAKAQSEDSDKKQSATTTTIKQSEEQTTNKPNGYFTIGSTKEEVLAVHGEPDNITKADGGQETWDYGKSTVTFSDGKVVEYYNYAGDLSVRLTSKESEEKHRYFTIGSKKGEVVAAQGTPDCITRLLGQELWGYGDSSVTFSGKKVVSCDNSGHNLRVRPRGED
ncbi:MAG TPA: serine/threonine-protein kinase [Anaerolineae bacterium]|nr:serine/threonine-protein kinase [Anaerolineae bacterium]